MPGQPRSESRREYSDNLLLCGGPELCGFRQVRGTAESVMSWLTASGSHAAVQTGSLNGSAASVELCSAATLVKFPEQPDTAEPGLGDPDFTARRQGSPS